MPCAVVVLVRLRGRLRRSSQRGRRISMAEERTHGMVLQELRGGGRACPPEVRALLLDNTDRWGPHDLGPAACPKDDKDDVAALWSSIFDIAGENEDTPVVDSIFALEGGWGECCMLGVAACDSYTPIAMVLVFVLTELGCRSRPSLCENGFPSAQSRHGSATGRLTLSKNARCIVHARSALLLSAGIASACMCIITTPYHGRRGAKDVAGRYAQSRTSGATHPSRRRW